MREIKEGDIVTVSMSRNNCFAWQSSCQIRHVKVLHTPADVGDLWYFEVEHLGPFALNPMCSEFIGMELVEHPEIKEGT